VTLQVRDIDTFYGTSHILHGVSLEMADRELFAVLGRNGAGKTTLLRSITGVNPPAVGSILLDGTEIAKLKSHRRTWLGISYVPQGREIIPDITVAENIYVALLGKGRKAKDVPKFIFDYFPALKSLLGQKGGTLSGGQQQQLAIGRALVAAPDVLLLDEPSLGLAPKVVDVVFDALAEVRTGGISVLLVEQRAQRTVAFADRTYLIANGVVRLTLTPADAHDTEAMVHAYLS